MKGGACASAILGHRLRFGFKQQHLAETTTDVSTPRSTQQAVLVALRRFEACCGARSCCQFKMTGMRKDVLVDTVQLRRQPAAVHRSDLSDVQRPASVHGRTQMNPDVTDLQALRPSYRARRMLCPQLGPSPAPQCAPASSPQPCPALRTPGSPRSGGTEEYSRFGIWLWQLRNERLDPPPPHGCRHVQRSGLLDVLDLAGSKAKEITKRGPRSLTP